jgi:hypothetical protein
MARDGKDTDTTMTTLTAPALSATDRCDRCSAQAYVRVVLPGGADLHFCGHHWHRHEDALRPRASEVIDERHRLTEQPSA